MLIIHVNNICVCVCVLRYKWGSDQPGSVSRFWVAVGFITNIIVLLLTWVCSTITIMSSKTLDVIVLNSVAVLFMVVLDDEIVSFADYSQIPNALGQGSVSRICQACDIVGGLLLKIQLLWKIPYICSILMFILTVIVPIGVLGCYNNEIIIHPTLCTTGTLDSFSTTTTTQNP